MRKKIFPFGVFLLIMGVLSCNGAATGGVTPAEYTPAVGGQEEQMSDENYTREDELAFVESFYREYSEIILTYDEVRYGELDGIRHKYCSRDLL